jgi:hypothetical protein
MTMLPEPDADRAIAAVLVRYATAIDTKDWPLLRTCFHASCTFAGRGGTLRLDGAAAVVAYMEAAHERIDGSLHRLSNIDIEVDGDGVSAKATSYLDALIVHRGHPAGPTFQLAAIYRDRLALDDGEWRIGRRDVTSLWSTGSPEILDPTLR